jgi:uncharacterized protein (DUF58 family)
MSPAGSEPFRHAKIPLTSRLKLKNVTPGESESIFAGEGIEYAATKPYEPGDNARDLDLQALAQAGEEEVVERVVDRQRRIYLWVDVSASMQRVPQMFFGSKPDIRDAAVGLLVFSALKAYSPVGLGALGHEVVRFFAARRGESYGQEIVEWFLAHADQGDYGTADLSHALAGWRVRLPAQSLVLFISDFQQAVFETDFAGLLKTTAARFDLVPIILRDPLESGAPPPLPVTLSIWDRATGRRVETDLTPRRFADLQAHSARHLAHLTHEFHKVGIDPVVLDSPSVPQCHRTLSAFFESRRRARR